ncbi:macro domain-containing protein [candidate division KSB1 bacterium]|nr:macro domain-containing protein [candidate division KSB1 bacterium]
MIKIARGNIVEADAEALVNTVNCVGYMGKGIALQFKQAFPKNFEAYAKACRAQNVKPGEMFVFETGQLLGPKYIINFPTKRHWRGKSRLEDIESGLHALVQTVKKLNIKTIAVPPLGCGLGGLQWSVVEPMIRKAFAEVPEVDLLLYAPHGSPHPAKMPVRTPRPAMTAARAMLIKLMAQYLELSYRMTLLEIQKLAYFLQEAGEPLQLRYHAGHYGPYAANLNKVLERLEGHFIRGYGDQQKPDAEIRLLPGAVRAAEEFLKDHGESRERLARVAEVIEGFETPYGVELLATVHWATRYAEPPATDESSAISAVSNWNERKRQTFKEPHIRVAWQRLAKQGWLSIERQVVFANAPEQQVV